MSRVLVVDDDGHIRDVMRFTLQQGGYQVVEAKDGAAAVTLFDAGGIDLIVLDIVMPESDGLEVCRRIRHKSRVPIIFVSSRDEELDRVLGLELGADDYLVKPFSPRELLARVKAVLRRLTPPPAEDKPQLQKRGALEMDLLRHRCTWMGKEVVLTVTEFALLQSLLAAPGRVFSRGELVDRAYGNGHVITERTVDSHVRRIRQKLAALGADPIETVYGLGYRLKEEL
ncbi:MAG: response regulator transcription factor [Myxococcales bacterium]|nr:response regulator transcription factor [Myxococcales bacterium]